MSTHPLRPILLGVLGALAVLFASPSAWPAEPAKEPPKAEAAPAPAAEAKAAEEAKAKAAADEAKAKAEAEAKAAEEAKRKAATKVEEKPADAPKPQPVPPRAEARAAVRVEGGVIEVQAGPVQVQPVGPGERRIFVPEAKGAGDTLDDTAKARKPGEGDVVTTIRGDSVVGKVSSIEGGKLRLTAPHFEGEVVVLANALERVEFLPTALSSGGDEVVLTNGDRVVGEIVSITPETVIVDSKATGPLKISRKVAESIAFAQGRSLLLESNFASGRMAPWTPEGGAWSVADGALQCTSHGDRQAVVAKFDQKEAVTMEAKVESTMGRYLNCELVIFADQSDGNYGQNSLVARFFSSQFYLMYVQGGGQNSVTNRSINNVMREGVFRLAYDPATAKARAWVDSMDLGEYAIPTKLAEGKMVMFIARQPCRVHYLRVVRGIVPPSSAEEKTDVATHVVRFGNKDRVAAEEIGLADGKLTLKTSFGDIASPVGKVQSIAFRSQGLEKPRRNKGDVYVETAESRLTVQFDRLTPEALFGKSSYLGDVKVSRAALKRLRFNIYQ
jgi:hypothetical protein